MTTRAWLCLSGYTLLFLVFGLIWLVLFFRNAFSGRKWVYLAAASTGAVAFNFAMTVQEYLQLSANNLFGRLGASVWVATVVTVLLSGLVQELFKLLAVRINGFIVYGKVDYLPLGLAVGLGFGFWEAWRLVAYVLGKEGIWYPLALLERFSAICLHIALGFIVAYGLKKGRSVYYYLIAALYHAAVNFLVPLYYFRLIGFWPMQLVVLLMALVAMALAYRLYRQERSGHISW